MGVVAYSCKQDVKFLQEKGNNGAEQTNTKGAALTVTSGRYESLFGFFNHVTC